ncbi:peptide-methionine (R)-S-oxide reductase MsrB [Succinivibrio dextrinosolvens]|uniref:peptide-methionine (R)-S-oxide reductase MsrB n=1 Tax=Succinivibrio dextrinosolvens TaxID=83771 RepID=UPI0004E179D4|nr:peptide-methionine (R)-S-oxide reductase MsrB [Succinivibrio dextrinosolvens]
MSTKTIYLAGGCFWGVSEYYSRIDGVTSSKSGYANSDVENPSYKEVKTGNTGAAETVEVVYDTDKVSLEILLTQFFKIIDPVAVNHQGEDFGSQYRTGIFYTDKSDLETIRAVVDYEQRKYEEKFALEILPLKNFFDAEDYHQDYLKKNPEGYCHVDFLSLSDLKPDNSRFIDKKKYAVDKREAIKEKLSDEAYKVTQNSATEKPFTGEYDKHFERGIYVDVITGAPLFKSTDKYESGCGWPAFSAPINQSVVSLHHDESDNRQRIEVRSKTSNAHLGHFFTDGPKDKGGIRFCINSAALKFIPYDRMDEEGYSEFKSLVK